MTRPVKITLVLLGIGALAVLAPIAWYVVLSLGDAVRSSNQKRALQSRSDYSQIATACVSLARGMTNENTLIKPTDPGVPGLLRSLSPRYISASSNYITMEFHGGFDHYGYRVRQSYTNPALWTISWYTEQGERLLTTITP